MTVVKSFDELLEVLAAVFASLRLRPESGQLTEALRNEAGFLKASRFCWGATDEQAANDDSSSSSSSSPSSFDLSAMSVGKLYIVSLLQADGTLYKTTILANSAREEVVEKLRHDLHLFELLEQNRAGAMAPAKAGLERLPEPVQMTVLSFLTLPDVVRCFHVCRGLYSVSRSLELWKGLYSRRAGPELTSGTREDVIKSYQHSQIRLTQRPRLEPSRSVVDPWQWTMLDYHYFDYL